MKNYPYLLVLAMIAALLYTVSPLCIERAYAEYNQEHFTNFTKDLNLSADQQQKLEAINRQFAAEQSRLDQKWKELKDEMDNSKDSSFYLQYGQQAGIHGTYFEHNPEAYLKACRSAYFRNQRNTIMKQLGELYKQKQEQTMAVLTPEQRIKWVEFHRDLQDK